MDIQLDPQFKAILLDKIAKREFKERTGVHVTDLLFCLNKQGLRRLKPLPPEEHDLLLYSLGWATQRWLTGQDKDEPEWEVDGITVTLDAVSDSIPWELKATFSSSEKPIEENPHWVRQVMAQCYVNGTTEAYLSRLEIMGNWKSVFGKKEDKGNPENRKPTLSVYKLTFTKNELQRNWEWLQERRRLFLGILETKQLLAKAQAIPSGQEWECERCPYRGSLCSL